MNNPCNFLFIQNEMEFLCIGDLEKLEFFSTELNEKWRYLLPISKVSKKRGD